MTSTEGTGITQQRNVIVVETPPHQTVTGSGQIHYQWYTVGDTGINYHSIRASIDILDFDYRMANIAKREVRPIVARLEQIEKRLDMREIIMVVEMTKEECKKLILEELEITSEGFYPSEFALKHSLDFDFVDDCFEELESEGKLEGS